MMKKLTLFSVVMLVMSVISFGQAVNPCGFDEAHNELMITNHNYEKAVRKMTNRWISYSKMMSTALLTYTSKGYVYEIPMVIHVIHTGETVSSTAKYNVDSTRIGQMIDYMNKNYAAEFPFPDSTTGASGGGTRIPLKFVLAKRTPNGAATNGIIRIDGTATYSSYAASGVRRSSSSGITTAQAMALSRWTPSDYYNVYVVNKIDGNDLYPPSPGGVAGFAYLPYFPTVDGMVVVASQVRSGSTVIAHEFGHAFSLLHTFQGDGGSATCPSNTDCTTDGDMVCDTEPHYGSNYWPGWCPPTDINPCTGISYKGVKYNVMDYTNCDYSYPGSVSGPDRFTAGQRTRVMSTLDNEHVAFKYSQGLVAPSGTITSATCTPTSSSATASVGPVTVTFNNTVVYTGDMQLEGTAYVDHSYTQQTKVSKGSVYPITISTEVQRQKVKVYIDYNNDGDFSDAGEEVFSNVGASSGAVDHKGNITIPTTATTCTWLRMRVVAALNSATITDMACGPYANNAQAEDYGILVQDATKDTVTIAQTVGTNPSCTGSSLTFSASSKKTLPSYRWYLNGVRTAVTTSTYTSSTIPDGTILTCKTFYTSPCGADSSESNQILVRVSSTALAVAKISLRAGSNPGCAGQRLVFQLSITGGGPSPLYSWRRNGIIVGTSDTFASSALLAGDRIWCRITPNSTCSVTPVNSDTITISFATVVPAANIAITSGSNPSCDSTSLTFTATPTNPGAAPMYQWYVNNTAVPGATSAFYTNTYLKNNDSIWCRMISNHPCIIPGTGDTAWSNKIIILRNLRTMPSLKVLLTKGANPGCLDSLLEYTATTTDAGGSPLVVWSVNGAIAAYGSIFSSAALLDKDTLTCKMYVTAGSCNSVDSLEWGPEVITLSTTPGTPVISLIGTLLVSSIPSGIQWYGPSGLIPGATGPTYHPTTAGSYYAIVNNNGCLGRQSNTLNVALLGISPYNMSEVRIYPNPASSMLTIDWGAEKMSGNIDVFTALGQRVINITVDNQDKQMIDMSNLANGNYFVVIRDSKGKTGTVTITVAH